MSIASRATMELKGLVFLVAVAAISYVLFRLIMGRPTDSNERPK
jgi:hypothetical protein